MELHHLLTLVDAVDPPVLDVPCDFDGPPVFSGTGSYADTNADVTWTTTEYAHSIGEVVMAAMHAGLAVTHLEEHTSMTFDPRGLEGSGLDEDGRYRLRIGQRRLEGESRNAPFPRPVLFTLLATAGGRHSPA